MSRAGTWDPATAATTFEQQYTAHPEINAVVTPNDDNANAVIAVLKKNKIAANTFPTTGQDASLPGLQNILTGYQCGTVYKPIYLEAQAAAALALYLRAGVEPPSTLVNATTADTEIGTDIPSVLHDPDLGDVGQHGRHGRGQGRCREGRRTSAPVTSRSACTDAGIS